EASCLCLVSCARLTPTAQTLLEYLQARNNKSCWLLYLRQWPIDKSGFPPDYVASRPSTGGLIPSQEIRVSVKFWSPIVVVFWLLSLSPAFGQIRGPVEVAPAVQHDVSE